MLIAFPKPLIVEHTLFIGFAGLKANSCFIGGGGGDYAFLTGRGASSA
jgi:hypothetical protein